MVGLLAALADLAALAALAVLDDPAASAARLRTPRTGLRGVKIHPTPGHRLSADQPVLVEEPGVLGVEFLEGVVRQHPGTDPLGHPQQEGVAPADRPRRGRDQLGVGDRLVEGLALGGIDPVAEGGVDHHDDLGPGELGLELP